MAATVAAGSQRASGTMAMAQGGLEVPRRPVIAVASVALLLPLVAAPIRATGPSVTITDLGTLGFDRGVATAVNAGGQIVGWSDAAFNTEHAFSMQGGVMTDLGTLGGAKSRATAVSDAGHVVGFSDLNASSAHAFLRFGGPLIDLGTLGGPYSSAQDVNASGTVVGDSVRVNNGQQHAFSWTAGAMVDLGLPGEALSSALKVSDGGLIIGISDDVGNFTPHGIVWQSGVPTDIAPGSASSLADLNEAGVAVGSVDSGGQFDAVSWSAAGGLVNLGASTQLATGIDEAGNIIGITDDGEGFYRAADGTSTVLPELAGQKIWPMDISAAGVVGYAGAAFTEAIFWTPAGGLVDLGFVPYGTFATSQAIAINDAGTIVGESSTRKVNVDSHPTQWRLGPAADVDTDGDGIVDAVDTQPALASTDFADGATTAGSITSPGGLALTISDAPDPVGSGSRPGPGPAPRSSPAAASRRRLPSSRACS